MNYLSVENISKSFGERVLFEGLNFGLNYGDKVALIANNGSGKTSMLKIIAGKDVPGTGKVTLRNGIRIGYLEQEPVFNEKYSINELLYNSNAEVVKIIREYDETIIGASLLGDPIELIVEKLFRTLSVLCYCRIFLSVLL